MSNNHYLDPYFRQYCCFHKVKQGLFVIILRFICNYLLRITLTGIEGVDQQKCYIFAEYIKFDRTDYNSYLNKLYVPPGSLTNVAPDRYYQYSFWGFLFYLNWWLFWQYSFWEFLWGTSYLSFRLLYFFFFWIRCLWHGLTLSYWLGVSMSPKV